MFLIVVGRYLAQDFRGFVHIARRKTGKTDLTPLSELISLSKKRALITGAGSGIGKATTCRFAEAGAD
jgi:FlaA1/EpsC-like NDP-sugar epimerase